jgi:type IV secretory pathway VirB10-like protein
MDDMQLPPVQPAQQNHAQASQPAMQDPNTVPPVMPIAPPNQQTQPATPQNTQTNAPQPQNPPEHKDLIDKEWLGRVKQVVAQYRYDPHEQSKKVALLRAEYLKRQYNKDVKVEDD